MTPEGIPILTPEELEELRAEFPDADLAVVEQLDQASRMAAPFLQWQQGKIDSGGMTLDQVQSAPDRMAAVREIVGPEAVAYAEDAQRRAGLAKLPNWDTKDPDARQRLDNYYSDVTNAMQQDVISVRAAAEVAATQMGLPDDEWEPAVQQLEQYLTASYTEGYMSPADFLREITIQPYLLQAERNGLDNRIVQAQMEVLDRRAAGLAQAVADQIGQKNYDPNVAAFADLVSQTVGAHAPGGPYAHYGHRTYAENAQVPKDKGDPAYYLTEDGAQNHNALRVAELFSAGSDGYVPSFGISQALRLATPFFVDGATKQDPFGRAVKEFVQMGSEAGKFGFASELYRKSGQGDRQQVYAQDDTPKYYSYDPTNALGFGNATTMNSSYPMARFYKSMAPVAEAAMHIAKPGDLQLPGNLRGLRNNHGRITPLVPDGVDPEQQRALGESLSEADNRMDGYLSARHGPQFADAWNATMGRLGFDEAERTYMSPALDTLLDVPSESLRDLPNAVGNLALPGVSGAVVGGVRGNLIGGLKGMAKGAAKGAAGGIARGVSNLGGDMVEESAETLAIAPATMGIQDFFRPEQNNLLMDGWLVEDKGGLRQGGPNDKGYDEEVERRHLDARQAQYETADAYGKAREKARKETTDRKPGRPVAEVRW